MIDQHVNESQKGAICHQGRRPGQRGAVSLSHSAPISDGPVVEPAEDNCEFQATGLSGPRDDAGVRPASMDPVSKPRRVAAADGRGSAAGPPGCQSIGSRAPQSWTLNVGNCTRTDGSHACSRGAVTGRIVSIQLFWHTKYVSCNIKLSNL